MKVDVTKSGNWAEGGIWIKEIKLGTQDMPKKLALELIEAGWAKAHEEAKEEDKVVVAPEVEADVIDRETLEEEYRALGGRVSDDWTDEDLVERIEKKKAK